MQDPLVTLVLYQIVFNKLETVNVLPFIVTLLVAVVVLVAVDQTGAAFVALTKLVLFCQITVEPAELPFKVRVVLLVNAVEIPDKFKVVATAHTVTFPPAIVPALRTTITKVAFVAH